MNKKKVKTLYWIMTIVFALFMGFSGVAGIIGSAAGNEVITGLGYPIYVNYILGLAKLLGSIAILVPRFNILKEWAYAGFTFDQLGAVASFFFAGFGLSAMIIPIISLVFMFCSYWLWKKSNKN